MNGCRRSAGRSSPAAGTVTGGGPGTSTSGGGASRAVEGLGGSYGEERLVVTRRRPGQTPAQEEERFPGPDGSWAAEWAEFESAIAERREPIGSGTDGLAALRAVRAIYRA